MIKTPSKAAVQRAADAMYTSPEHRAAVRSALRADKGGFLVDVLSERYADAAISSGEGPEPTTDSLAEAVAMHLVETS